MGYDLIVVKTLERVYKNYYYIIHNTRRDVFIVLKKYRDYDKQVIPICTTLIMYRQQKF